MRVILLAAVSLSISVRAAGSPIQESVISLDHLKRIGATIRTKEYEDGSGISVQVEWEPAANLDDAFPPRLDLIFYKGGRDGQTALAARRLQVRFSDRIDGKLHADFTVSPSEMAHAELWFRESQKVHYCLALNELIDGFPKLDADFFDQPGVETTTSSLVFDDPPQLSRNPAIRFGARWWGLLCLSVRLNREDRPHVFYCFSGVDRRSHYESHQWRSEASNFDFYRWGDCDCPSVFSRRWLCLY